MVRAPIIIQSNFWLSEEKSKGVRIDKRKGMGKIKELLEGYNGIFCFKCFLNGRWLWKPDAKSKQKGNGGR